MGSMETNNVVKDVQQMAERLMIDLFKKKIQEKELRSDLLKGTWTEASQILQSHFGKVSRVMTSHQDSLQTLYQTAIKELKQV